MLSISIVIYHYNGDLFGRLLNSLRIGIHQLPNVDRPVSITIIDNGDNKEVLTTSLKQYDDSLIDFTVVRPGVNLGYGKAQNIAINNARSKYHLILNPDVILDSDCLKNGIAHLFRDPDTAAVTPNTVDMDGQKQYLAKSYPSVFNLVLRGLMPVKIRRLFKSRLEKYELRAGTSGSENTDVDIMSGCFMLCRTEVLQKVNGFDEQYFLYFEDFALSLELGKYGKLVYLPGMKIQHFGGEAAKKGAKHILMFMRSGIKFFNKYGWKFV